MWESGMRAYLSARWRLTPFSAKQRAVTLMASKLDSALGLAEDMGLLQELDVLKRPVDGPNAAEQYERLTSEINALAAQVHGTPAILQRISTASVVSDTFLRDVLTVWSGVLDVAQPTIETHSCRLPDRYILEDTEFEPLTTMKTLAFGYAARIRLKLGDNIDGVRRDLFSLAHLSRHSASEPLKMGALVSTRIARAWFRVAGLCLRYPELRSSVEDSLALLPALPTLRSVIPGEIQYARAFANRPPATFDSMGRHRMPRHMIDDLKTLDGMTRACATESILAYCRLARRLPDDEATDGPSSSRVFFENVLHDSHGLLGIRTKWTLITAPDKIQTSMLEAYRKTGSIAATNQSMRNVIRLALECYRAAETTGRFPDSLHGEIDPVSLLPYEYRNHGERFLIFGNGVEFDSHITGFLP